MKKSFIVLAGIALLMTGCSSGVSQEEYDSLAAQVSEAEIKNQEQESMYDDLNSSYSELKDDHQSMSSEYAAYKESMQEYEDLESAEALARKIEAESIAAASSAAEEEAKIAAEVSKAAEEAEIAASIAAEEEKGYETGITYDQLARTPDDFKGQKVKFTGKVVQVLEDGASVYIRLAVDQNYDTILYGTYSSSLVGSRVLEDDIITVYGTSNGLKSYQSTLGATITIPDVSIEKVEQ